MVNKLNLLTDLKYGWRWHSVETTLSIWPRQKTDTKLIMADKRKLQCEIDRTLKKIVEGIEIFDDMWEKVYSATNCNMKEKQEAELKKEIKKLQRLRDFVKNWLASNEIKDKNSLLEHKKLIEIKMEQFKIIERETKTKAYSTVGLGAAAKVDPKEKEKDDIRNWLSSQIDALNLQVDQIESEVESIISKKKKLEKEKLEQVENYRLHLEQHRFHIGRLELTMRLVDNDALDLQMINKIKDNVEYYVSLGYDQPTSSEDSMMYLYDELNLDEESEALGSKLTSKLCYDGDERISETSDPGRDSLPSPISSPTFHSQRSASEEEKPKVVSLLSLDSKQVNGPSHHHHHHPTLKSSVSLSSHHHFNAKHFNEVVGSSGTTDIPKSSSEETRRSSSSSVYVANSNSEPSSEAKTSVPLLTQNYAKVASSHVSNKSSLLSDLRSSSSSSPSNITTTPPTFTVTSTSELTILVSSANSVVSLPSPSPHMSLKQLSLSAAMKINHLSECEGIFDAKTSIRLQGSSCVFESDASAACGNRDLSSSTSHSSQTSRFLTSASLHFLSPARTSSTTKTVHIHPLLSVSPLGQQPLDQVQKLQLLMVESALHRLPQPMDSEKHKPVLQRRPGYVPPYYAPYSPPLYDSIEFFNQLHIETLFFIFYYMEGTKAQYLAAKALKLKSWRFHTKLLMWFQRFEEPKIITEEFEQGSYLFFDFESWAQRQQDEFMFEYRYLEDHDLN